MATIATRTVTIHEAKTNLSRLIAAVEAGEEIIVARGKVPVMKMVPLHAKPKRVPGLLKGLIEIGPEFFEPMSEEELALWEGRDEF